MYFLIILEFLRLCLDFELIYIKNMQIDVWYSFFGRQTIHVTTTRHKGFLLFFLNKIPTPSGPK